MSYPTVDSALAEGPGRRLAAIPVALLASGLEGQVFVHVRVGQREGPRIAIVAGTHGGASFAAELLRVFAAQMILEELAGTLLIVPMANLLALETGARHAPTDVADLGRDFPGDPGGRYTDRLAHAIVTGLLPHCDRVVDLRCPSRCERTARYAHTHRDPSTPYGRKVHEMALTSGAPILYAAPRVVGSLADCCEQLGIPTLTTMIGGSDTLHAAHMEACLRELNNVLRHLGALAGKPALPDRQMVLREAAALRPRSGGLLCPRVGFDMLGVPFSGPRVLAKLVNAATFEQIEEIGTPFANSVLVALLGSCRVHPGDHGFCVGNVDTADMVPGAPVQEP